jgi:low affinity Fe/Cu permease
MGRRCCGMSGCYSRCPSYGYPGEHLVFVNRVMNDITLFLSRSFIFFMMSVLAFVWRIGQHGPFSDAIDTCGRILITGVLVVGIVHLTSVLITLRTCGRTMDAKWRERVEGWARERRNSITLGSTPGQSLPPPGVNTCPSQLPPAGAYTPTYPPDTQWPFLSWAAANQPEQDLPFWQMPQAGTMNEAYTSCIPGQPLDVIQDHRINLQSPTSLGSASGRSS